jgi:tricarballylate dehydrogenase
MSARSSARFLAVGAADGQGGMRGSETLGSTRSLTPVVRVPARPDNRARAVRAGSRFPAPDWANQEWDVVVVGGGNAAVVSAFSAADLGARTLILERAPWEMRGGNTRHTRNIRCIHGHDAYNVGDYRYEELWDDLCNVGEGPGDEELASLTVRESEFIPGWMSRHGARWQQPLAGTLHLGRTNRFFLGGGKALLNSYYRQLARTRGVTVAYQAKVEELLFDGDRCTSLLASFGGGTYEVRAKAVVCASGGFEANLGWLRRYWGDAVDNYIIRGTPHNDGHILEQLYQAGAARAGQERGFHAIALDARAPRFDGGIATRLDCIPFGIVVNKFGQRFYDEGEDIWPKRYAAWGTHLAQQPDQIAYALWDSKVNHLFLPPMNGSVSAGNVADLAAGMGLDPGVVSRTVTGYNQAVRDSAAFNPAVLDGRGTKGLEPAKTNWAQRIDDPPYYGIAMRPGITFTYMGVAVDADARVKCAGGSKFSNVFAAGEIMSGNILSTGYLAGFGMTIGTVWGRRAGQGAATYATE